MDSELLTRILDVGVAFTVLVIYIVRSEMNHREEMKRQREIYAERIQQAEERSDRLQRLYDVLHARYLVDLRFMAKMPKPNGFEEDLQTELKVVDIPEKED